MSTLKVGKARYGLMLNELGVVIDDGVALRLAEDRFWVGTTGAGGDRIASWMEEWLQCEWLDLKVIVAPVTQAWAVLTLTGPCAREVLALMDTDLDLDPARFPHLSFQDGHVARIPARVARVSYTGETSFEINVPARRAAELGDLLMARGADFGIAPIGIDAWTLLRTEKGFVHVGADTDGSTTPLDMGWSRVLKKKSDFVGRRSLTRPADARTDRLQFVGLRAADDGVLPIGAHLARDGGKTSEGYVTSSGYSPVLGRGVALGMVRGGEARIGEKLHVIMGGSHRAVRIVPLCSYDPEGERINGETGRAARHRYRGGRCRKDHDAVAAQAS